MNNKVVAGVAVVGVIILGAAGYYVLKLRAETAKWAGPFEEIVDEENRTEGGGSFTKFVSLVDAPIDKVQEALWSVEKSKDLIENVRASKLIKQSPGIKVVEMHFQALSLPVQVFTMEFQLDADHHRISFRTIESQTQDLKGVYRLEGSPDGRQTRVTYEVHRRDKVNLPAPESVVESASRETFVNTVRGVRKWIAQQGRARE